jgi:hypothetical protein
MFLNLAFSSTEQELAEYSIHRKSQINYENNMMIDGQLDLTSQNYDLSLTSSVKNFSSAYIQKVLGEITTQMKAHEKSRGSKKSWHSAESGRHVIIDKDMMDGSDSESVDGFGASKVGIFSQAISEVIDIKVKTILKSMTGLGAIFDKVENEETKERRQTEQATGESQEDNRGPRGTILSSNMSQGAAVVAHEYLNNVFTNSIQAVLGQGATPAVQLPGNNEIQFTR